MWKQYEVTLISKPEFEHTVPYWSIVSTVIARSKKNAIKLALENSPKYQFKSIKEV